MAAAYRSNAVEVAPSVLLLRSLLTGAPACADNRISPERQKPRCRPAPSGWRRKTHSISCAHATLRAIGFNLEKTVEKILSIGVDLTNDRNCQWGRQCRVHRGNPEGMAGFSFEGGVARS